MDKLTGIRVAILDKLVDSIKAIKPDSQTAIMCCQELFQMFGAVIEYEQAKDTVGYHTLMRIIADYQTACGENNEFADRSQWCQDHEGRYVNED